MKPITATERRQLEELLELARQYRDAYAGSAGELGSRGTEVLLLVACDGPIGPAQIARALGRDRAAVSRALHQLTEAKLVEGEYPDGSRRLLYTATAAGLKIARARL